MSDNFLTLFDNMFDDNFKPALRRGTNSFWSVPALNIREFKDSYQISVNAPGIDGDKINVELQENLLVISYEDEEKKEEQEKEDESMVRQEYSEYVSFKRSVSLPKNIDPDSIKAGYNRGVLRVTINKQPEAQPKKISVKVDEK